MTQSDLGRKIGPCPLLGCNGSWHASNTQTLKDGREVFYVLCDGCDIRGDVRQQKV